MWILLLGLQLYRYLEEAENGKFHFKFLALISVMLFALFAFYNAIWVSIKNPITLTFYFAIIAFFIIYYIRRHEPFGFLKAFASAAFVMGGGLVSSNFFSMSAMLEHRFILTVISSCLFFAAILPRHLKAKKEFNFIYVLSILLLAFPISYIDFYFLAQKSYASVRQELVNYLVTNADNKPVYFFSTETYYTFPGLDYAKLENASRFPFFWMLPGMIQGELDPKQNMQIQQDKKLLINMIAEDISRNKPELVLVDVNYKYMPVSNFNYIDYFINNSVMQPIWQHYTYLQTIKEDGFFNFQVYRRKPDNYAAK
jgi:hypothetical protein